MVSSKTRKSVNNGGGKKKRRVEDKRVYFSDMRALYMWHGTDECYERLPLFGRSSLTPFMCSFGWASFSRRQPRILKPSWGGDAVGMGQTTQFDGGLREQSGRSFGSRVAK